MKETKTSEEIIKSYCAGNLPFWSAKAKCIAEDFAEQARMDESDRIRKHIEGIQNMSFEKGRPGCTWLDTEFDSESAAAGYNQALTYCKEIVSEAIAVAGYVKEG